MSLISTNTSPGRHPCADQSEAISTSSTNGSYSSHTTNQNSSFIIGVKGRLAETAKNCLQKTWEGESDKEGLAQHPYGEAIMKGMIAGTREGFFEGKEAQEMFEQLEQLKRLSDRSKIEELPPEGTLRAHLYTFSEKAKGAAFHIFGKLYGLFQGEKPEQPANGGDDSHPTRNYTYLTAGVIALFFLQHGVSLHYRRDGHFF